MVLGSSDYDGGGSVVVVAILKCSIIVYLAIYETLRFLVVVVAV